MSKAPAFQFYPGDWRKDTQVQMMNMTARGVWFEMLCCMWEAPERGKLEGTRAQMCRLLGCSEQELDIALKELSVTKTGDVTECNDLVTVINRRMYREERERKLTRSRVQKYRVTQKTESCNDDVTLPSSSSSSSSCTKVQSIVSVNTDTSLDENTSGVENCPQQKIIDLYHFNSSSSQLPVPGHPSEHIALITL